MTSDFTDDRVTIALVDDHPTLLLGLAALVGAEYRVIGTGSNATQAIELASLEPKLMLLDLSMPGDAFAAMGEVLRISPETKIIVFTAYAEVGLAKRAIENGATGFILKGGPVDELRHALQAARRDEHVISEAVQITGDTGHRSARLSARETQLLKCLLNAMSNKEIANDLGLTEKTVKHYMTNLMTKLNARNRLEAVLAARRMGLTPPRPGEEHGLGPSLQS